jgi:predicted RNase H-like HicB family nuclease
MARHNPDFDYDEEEFIYESGELFDSEDEEQLLDGEADLEDILDNDHSSADKGVEVSMEVDAEGREIWYAADPRVPGSASMGHSAEEAVDGVDERRREYREILRRSREGLQEDEGEPTLPPDSVSGEHDVEISLEVDEAGRELWYAKDPRVPGSNSIGHSAEEAVDGLEQRRREYREMLKKSRKKRNKKQKE